MARDVVLSIQNVNIILFLHGGSSSGRTTDSDSVNLGSNPSPPANKNIGLAGLLTLPFSLNTFPFNTPGSTLCSVY
jgi:hypothetical protein